MVKDANGQALAYMYFEKEPLRRYRRSELLTRDEAQRIAAIFAFLKLEAPVLVGRGFSFRMTQNAAPITFCRSVMQDR